MQKKKPSSKVKIQQHDYTSLKGLAFFSISIAIMLGSLSFAYGQDSRNWLGLLGFALGKFFHSFLGIGTYLVSLYLGWMGWRKLLLKPIHYPKIKTLYFLVMLISLGMLTSLMEDSSEAARLNLQKIFYPRFMHKTYYHPGGAFFYFFYKDLPGFNLHNIFNSVGVLLLFSSTFLASVLFFTKSKPMQWLKGFINWLKEAKIQASELKNEEGVQEIIPPSSLARYVSLRIPGASTNMPSKVENNLQVPQELLAIKPETNLTIRPSISQKRSGLQEKAEKFFSSPTLNKEEKLTPLLKIEHTPEVKLEQKLEQKPEFKLDQKLKGKKREENKSSTGNFGSFVMPGLQLLTAAKKVDQSSLKQDLRRQAEVLEETLLSFGIEAKVGQINCGPTITSFEVHPAIGVKVQKIKTLENDIALNMEAKSIRIIAPIPGKAAVGIEVPNPHPQEVGYKDMLQAYQQGNRKMHIPVLLGKAVNGDYVMSDLAKMPHCIIAGATGSGKSVCVNTIVISILMNAKPDEIKLIMIDPKKVELTPYTRLPHMLAPVITEPQGACAALNWLVKEMENRYELLKQLGVRNIESFNNRVINKELEAALERDIPVRLPYIVVIIDEFADLMMVSSNDIETPIARIAQMARAVGIHMILATQRPSREVITGLIKANFPTRISFKVSSRVNSQIVLDESGAELLLGNGDMLFLPPGSSTLVRAQGAFIRDEDIGAVVKQICEQSPPNYVIASFDVLGKESENEAFDAPSDSLYDQALEIVTASGNASTTFLQRKLKIGYARAASLIDELEFQNVITPSENGKPRKVLVKKECLVEEKSAQSVEEPEDFS